MRSREKMIFNVGILLLIFIAVYFIGSQFFSIGSLGVLSLDQVEYDDGSQAWRVYVVASGSDQVVGKYALPGSQYLQAKTGEVSSEKFYVALNNWDERCEYKVAYTDDFFYKYKMEKSDFGAPFFGRKTAEQKLQDLGYEVVKCSYDKIYCLGKKKVGRLGKYISKNIRETGDIYLQAGSKTASSHFDTLTGQTTGYLANGRVYYEWKGNLVSGRECAEASLLNSEYPPVYTISATSGKWYISSREVIEDYEREEQELLSMDLDRDNPNTISVKANDVSAAADDIFGNYLPYSFGTGDFRGITAYDRDAVNVLSLKPRERIQIPSFLFIIKADWLGVKKNHPMPKLSVVNPNVEFKDNFKGGELLLDVKNVGDSGEIEIRKKSGDKFTVKTKRVQVNGGETRRVSLEVFSLSDESVTDTITIEACGVSEDSYFGKCDSVTFTVKYTATYVGCERLGAILCKENMVYVCKDRGDGIQDWVLLEDCTASNKICNEDKGGCVDLEGTVIPCSTDAECDDGNPCTEDKCVFSVTEMKKVCKHTYNPNLPGCALPKKTNWGRYLLYGLIIAIGGLMGYLRGRRKDKVVAAAIGAAVGGVAVYVINWFLNLGTLSKIGLILGITAAPLLLTYILMISGIGVFLVALYLTLKERR